MQDLTQQFTDLGATLGTIGAEVDKIGTETTSLVQKIGDLETQLANAGNLTPEAQAAFDAVKAQVASLATRVQAVDDLVPDAPPAP